MTNSFLLVRHPKTIEKLRAEIESTFKGSTEITRSDLKKMDYLQNVLKESKTMLTYIEHMSVHVLTCDCSPSPLSFGARQHPDSHEDHNAPCRGWSRSKVSGLGIQRYNNRIQRVRYAQTSRPIWHGRRTLSPRPLERAYASPR